MVNIRTGVMDDRMEINVLDYRLKVMTINKSAISKFTYALLDVIFLRHYLNNNHKEHLGFFSITETEEDFSIIIEEDALKLFDTTSDDLKVNEQTWVPLVTTAGPSPTQYTMTGISKIAKSVVIPLADQGISVYPLSTYRTDYVLIIEADFSKVCHVLASNFRIMREGILDSQEIIVDPAMIKKSSPAAASSKRPVTHSFDCSNKTTYCITSMDSEKLPSQALTIMDLLFYSGKTHTASDSPSCFFNFSIICNYVSFALDSALLKRFPPKLLFNNDEFWHLIKIGDMPEGVGFTEAGIVAQISEPIASAHISEYYISSFYYGHVLVPVEHFKEVKNLLETRRDQKKAAVAALSQSA